MKIKLAYFLLISMLILGSCTPTIEKEQGLSYSEFVNNQELTESVVSTYPSGQKKAVVYFIKGESDKEIVKEVHFFENGNIQVEGTLKNKKRQGIWTFYYDNGKIWSTGEFNDGNSEGIFNIYDKEGLLKIKSYYKNNKKVKEDYFSKGIFLKSKDFK